MDDAKIIFKNKDIEISQKNKKLYIETELEIIFNEGLTLTVNGPLNLVATGCVNVDTGYEFTGSVVTINSQQSTQLNDVKKEYLIKNKKEEETVY
jgi:hypothetical protein